MSETDECLIPFELPKNFMIYGATQSGKSHFVRSLLLNHEKMFTEKVNKIIYVYSIWHENFDEMQSYLGDMIEFVTHVPTKKELIEIWEKNKSHTILVLDVKMCSFDDAKIGAHIVDIVCVLSHHGNISCIITLQNMFCNNKAVKTVNLNAHYICLFRNNRSCRQVITLGSQIMPGNSEYFMSSYLQATERKYGYLLIDLTLNTVKNLQLRACLFPGDVTVCYLPKK